MLSLEEATSIVNKAIPNGKIQSSVVYRNLYLFIVFTDNIGEEEMDPFYSVDQETGAFSDFSIIEDGDMSEIIPLFEAAQQGR